MAAGEWEEHLEISKSLTLQGQPGHTTVRGHSGYLPVLRVHTPGAGPAMCSDDGPLHDRLPVAHKEF